MHPAIEKRLKRLRADLMFAEDQEIAHRRMLRARIEVGNKLRQMLQERGVDPASIKMMSAVDEAEAELARKPDSPAWRDAEAAWEAAQPNRDREIDAFYGEIVRIALIHFADGHQPGPGGSLMEWHAWCIATPASKHEPSPFNDYFVQSYQRFYHQSVAADLANSRGRPIR
jgi:hypothetical protein